MGSGQIWTDHTLIAAQLPDQFTCLCKPIQLTLSTNFDGLYELLQSSRTIFVFTNYFLFLLSRSCTLQHLFLTACQHGKLESKMFNITISLHEDMHSSPTFTCRCMYTAAPFVDHFPDDAILSQQFLANTKASTPNATQVHYETDSGASSLHSDFRALPLHSIETMLGQPRILILWRLCT